MKPVWLAELVELVKPMTGFLSAPLGGRWPGASAHTVPHIWRTHRT